MFLTSREVYSIGSIRTWQTALARFAILLYAIFRQIDLRFGEMVLRVLFSILRPGVPAAEKLNPGWQLHREIKLKLKHPINTLLIAMH
jgi:hypothetical protein